MSVRSAYPLSFVISPLSFFKIPAKSPLVLGGGIWYHFHR